MRTNSGDGGTPVSIRSGGGGVSPIIRDVNDREFLSMRHVLSASTFYDLLVSRVYDYSSEIVPDRTVVSDPRPGHCSPVTMCAVNGSAETIQDSGMGMSATGRCPRQSNISPKGISRVRCIPATRSGPVSSSKRTKCSATASACRPFRTFSISPTARSRRRIPAGQSRIQFHDPEGGAQDGLF